MIAHIEGTLTERRDNSVVIDVGGVGFLVHTNASAVPSDKPRVKLLTRLIVREDALDLFGFLTKEECAMFDRLTTISGVGPKLALSILSSLSVRDLALALVTDDQRTLMRAPGVGKKLAARLVLEMKERIGNDELTASPTSGALTASARNPAAREALEALLALGYASGEASLALDAVKDQAEDVSTLVRLALRSMDKR